MALPLCHGAVDLKRNADHHALMKKSTGWLRGLLSSLEQSARAQGLTDSEWATRAGLRKETLSRLRHRSSCDLATLEALAQVVGSQLAVTPPSASGTVRQRSPDGHFPLYVDRDYEEELLKLCALGPGDPTHWASLGPPFFMSGLAVMMASVPGADRRGLLALAEALHPGASEPAVFAQWLKGSPVRPSRFLPMLEQEVRHAA